MNKKTLIPILVALLSSEVVRAHCPLCTIGAAAAAGGAAILGVNNVAIGLFVGAFSVSIGWWIANLIKKQYVRYQNYAIVGFSFVTTVLPMMSFLSDIHPLYISWLGSYGTTFVVDLFMITSVIGGTVVSLTPWLSKTITTWRKGKKIPYQGILLTLSLLVAIATVLQIIL